VGSNSHPIKKLQDLTKIPLEKFGSFKFFLYLCSVNERQTEVSENLEKSRKNENPKALWKAAFSLRFGFSKSD